MFSEQPEAEGSSSLENGAPGQDLAHGGGEERKDTFTLNLEQMEGVEVLPVTGETAIGDNESSSFPTSPLSLTSPLLPLPDFMTALNMQPQAEGVRWEGPVGVASNPVVKEEEEEEGKMSLGPGPKEVLIEKFKQNPNGVLGLLQSALSMEKLSNLLQEEHRTDSELLLQLQNRLEAAYHTLRECEETKAELSLKMADTNKQVGEKRKHLEDLRGELKILGDEELKLKRRRDFSQGKYSDLKKRLTCSSEALEQIAQITKCMSPTRATPPDPGHQGNGKTNNGIHSNNGDKGHDQT